jgi:hypothetical protein
MPTEPIALYEWILLRAQVRKLGIYPHPITPVFLEQLANYIASRWWRRSARLHEAAKASTSYIAARLKEQHPKYDGTSICLLLHEHGIVPIPPPSEDTIPFYNRTDAMLRPMFDEIVHEERRPTK